MNDNILGENVKLLRKNLGITQNQLSKALNVSSSTIGMYEQGRRKPNSDMLSKMCVKLNTTTDTLLGIKSIEQVDINDLVDEFIRNIKYNKMVKYNGKSISEEDRDKIIAAIRIATQVIGIVPKNIDI